MTVTNLRYRAAGRTEHRTSNIEQGMVNSEGGTNDFVFRHSLFDILRFRALTVGGLKLRTKDSPAASLRRHTASRFRWELRLSGWPAVGEHGFRRRIAASSSGKSTVAYRRR